MTNAAPQTVSNDYPTGIFTSTLTGNESFLTDHVIQGRKILPGMAYLEMARAAVALSTTVPDDHMLVLSDSVFIQPLIVQGECAVETRVYPGAPGEFGVEVVTSQGVHFQSNVRIRDRREHAAESPSSMHLDVAALGARCTVATLAGQQVYSDFRKIGIHYGPSHRGIEAVRLGSDCALATLFLQGSSAQGLDLSPGMLDSVIQSGAVLSGHEDGIRVPFIAKSTSIYGPLIDRAHAWVTRTDQGLDYTIADDKGDVKVVITGFVARELDLSSTEDALLYYGVEWREEDVAGDSDENVTVIAEQTDYAGLVKAVIESARGLIQAGAGRHVIEVRLPEEQPAWLGVIGLLETINREYSKIGYRLKAGERYVEPRYSAKELNGVPLYAWPDGRTILITGGLGGVGTVIAEDVARSSRGCTLILAGRSELDAEKRNVIERLERTGTTVIHAQCDLADRAEVNALIARHTEISGVIHCAGVIQDSFILDKTAEAIDQVLAPKVQALQYLDEATAGLKLDYFVAVSSIVGALGNAGQADYAAANGYMDAYLRNRALQVDSGRRHGKSISINWPLWEHGGMQLDPATRQNLQRIFRSRALPDASAMTALKQILAGDEPQVLVFLGDRKAVGEMLEKAGVHARTAKTEKTFSIATIRLVREILHEIKIQTAEHLSLRLPPAQLDEEADWAEFGFDSIILSSFVNKLNARFNLDLLPTALFEATNMLRFSDYLAKNYPRQMAAGLSLAADDEPDTPVVAVESEPEPETISAFARSFRKAYAARVAYREEDVAIIGMSCRTAGARNTEELWRLLLDEKDMITEIPRDRWDWTAYPDAVKWGSFIDGVDEFDSLFFGISPAEARYMAPEQRLMMQSVWECVENAGCGDAIKGTNTGIFVGCGASSYIWMLSHMPIESYSSTGAVPSVGPNRISYLMDWHGPSEPIETACSSSLVAVHRAVEAIRRGHCDQAVAGGVNLLLAPDVYVSFTKAGMLCDDGRCKTFSDDSNGYVRGEGIGMILLKPLRAALEDGNIIHAVIKGTAENHGGRTNSLTAPNPMAQAAVVKKAIGDAGLEFDRISYVECHGTGTALGDPVEIEGLKMAAAQGPEDGDPARRCWLGSIKSNIGHLEMAAGIIGLIKVVLQMQHRKIARSLHCDTINRYIDLAGTPFVIAQTASDWEVAPGERRVAGVSSFGFGGVNAHVVLEEAPELPAGDDRPDTSAEQPPQLLVVSARTEESLLNYLGQYPGYLRTLPQDGTTLKRLAFTLQLGRAEMQERVAFIARSIDEWAEQLDSYLRSEGRVHHRNIHRGSVSAGNTLDIGDTQAGRDYLRQLLQDNESAKLAELWVKGTKIDWTALHSDSAAGSLASDRA
jgi:3-oxoacyl-(acyl-carrier-protein) synthase/NAD(P)-dependent dehydrogenase (short-subunit alcohol dehydrogenase family)